MRYPVVPIRKVARLGTGHTPSRQHPEYWENCSIPWLTLADVAKLRDGTRKVIDTTAEMISEQGVANSSAVVHPAGTVALSRTASVGFSCILGRPIESRRRGSRKIHHYITLATDQRLQASKQANASATVVGLE